MAFPICSQFSEKSLTVQAALALACAELFPPSKSTGLEERAVNQL